MAPPPGRRSCRNYGCFPHLPSGLGQSKDGCDTQGNVSLVMGSMLGAVISRGVCECSLGIPPMSEILQSSRKHHLFSDNT